MMMSTAYRLALYLLPAGLRRKHGAAMASLFARDLAQARARGALHVAFVGTSGVWDVVRRAAYEQLRPHGAVVELSQLGDASMPLPTTRALLRRHAASFAIAFVGLTAALLFLFARNAVPALDAKGTSAGSVAEVLLLAVPFISAMTIPMAVFLAVLYEFTRLGAHGTLAVAPRTRDGVRHLVVPVLAAAACVAALALVLTTEVVPRANARLAVVRNGPATAPNDRTMTIGELREAARNVAPAAASVASVASVARSRVAGYEVEVQKKLALPTACVVLALAAMAIAFTIPRGGTMLVVGASPVVFGAYYMLMMTGENLADRLVVSPWVGMWGANALVLTATLLAAWRRRTPRLPGDGRPQLIDG